MMFFFFSAGGYKLYSTYQGIFNLPIDKHMDGNTCGQLDLLEETSFKYPKFRQ